MFTLWVIGGIFAYIFIAGLSAASHHNRKRELKRHAKGYCFDGTWCNHACESVWYAGVFWPLFLPAALGVSMAQIGTGPSRTDKRREREIEEANHKVRLAEIRAKETAALEKELGIAS